MHVLLIEDNEDDARLIQEALSEHSPYFFTLDWVDRLDAAFLRLQHKAADAILLDLSLPDSRGLATLDKVRAQVAEAPVVVLTGLDDEVVAEEALRHGAQDYLVKGRFNGDSLRRSIRYALGRHQVEQALRKSEEQFQLVCLATRDVIWDWDIETDTSQRNEAYETEFGYDQRTQHNGWSVWSERLHPDDRPGIVADMTKILRSGQHIWSGEYRFRRADGTYAYVIDRAYVVRKPDGTPRRMIGAMTDITERHQAATLTATQVAISFALEEAVSLSEAVPKIIRAVCELKGWALGAFWVVNTKTKVLRCNALWHQAEFQAEEFAVLYRSLSLTPGMGLAGQVLKSGNALLTADILSDPTFPAANEAKRIGLRGGIAFPIHKGNDILGIMEFLTQDVLHPTDNTLHVVSDLGDKVSQFLEQKDLERQLRQAQKMDALGRMAGGIAHDFNNLLTVINSWSELLLADPNADPRARRGLLQIRDAGTKAAGLTRQLLAFTRHQVTMTQVLNLNDRVTDIVELMRRVIGEDIDLVVTLDPTLGMIEADPGQIEQVVMNLVVNARDAMPKGGRLDLQTKEVEISGPDPSWHDPLQPGAYVTLSVRDNGCGMDAETMSHIFEPFYTTKDLGKGTGLGLSTVYGIVKQGGGTIGVQSEPGIGTTFTIYLPRVVKEPAALPRPKPEPERASTGGTILLIEDDDMVRTLAQSVLADQRYSVISARNAEEALSISRRPDTNIALLVTDVTMPGTVGTALATEITASRPDVKVIITSGDGNRNPEVETTFGSRVTFLEKPYTPDSLMRAVREALEPPAEMPRTSSRTLT
ncbi:MAG: response regulator [Nitrospiraceae bacterium]|nr:response regulator [Nitrospiraceae bacterium]